MDFIYILQKKEGKRNEMKKREFQRKGKCNRGV